MAPRADTAPENKPMKPRSKAAKPETIDEACLGGRMEVGEHGPQAGEVRAMKAVEVDRAHRHDPNADR